MRESFRSLALAFVAISSGSLFAAEPVHWESPETVRTGDPRNALRASRVPTPATDAQPSARIWSRGPYHSIQVNVDYLGRNIVGDAANEPSIAIDPNDRTRMVIGWRQFDTVYSDFRQAGWGYSHNAGLNWIFPGVLDQKNWGSDPVLDFDADGNFYYHSIRCPGGDCGYLFKSIDGGRTWSDPVPTTMGDKPWMAIDRTNGIGRGNIYCTARHGDGFARSIDGGRSFEGLPFYRPWRGTIAVASDGVLHAVSAGGSYYNVVNLDDPAVEPSFGLHREIPLCPDGGSAPAAPGGDVAAGALRPNRDGLLGQAWVATDHSEGPTCGNVYALVGTSCVDGDPRDIMFARSVDGGATWSAPIRVNDDPPGAWQWFETMSVAPNGRIDVVWNDTRTSGEANLSELHYAYSTDGGVTFSPNVAVSPMFDSHVGWPIQEKIGDYYDMISDDLGANVAYAATFNGEQDAYYLRIGPWDCNTNGTDDLLDIQAGVSADCNDNEIPDECERDCNDNGTPDACDLADGSSSDDNGDDLLDECEVRLYVDATARGAGTGVTWVDAYTDLQDALVAATGAGGNVRDIWVASGVYTPDWGTGDRRARFDLPGGVALYGGFAGGETDLSQRDPALNLTVLSGDLLGDDAPNGENNDDNSFRVVKVGSLGVDATIDGLTISGGFTRGLPPNGRGFPNYLPRGGPAIFSTSRRLAVTNCAIVGNTSSFEAGAVYCLGGTPRLINCRFEANSVEAQHAVSGGAALTTVATNTVVDGCVFVDNHSGTWGGAIGGEFDNISISNSVFVANTSPYGGAFAGWEGTAAVTNCLFSGNTSSAGTGGIVHDYGSLAVAGTTFAGNAGRYGAAVSFSHGDLALLNCVLWDDETAQNQGEFVEIWARYSATVSLDYSCVRGLTDEYGGVGNTGGDPLFVDAAGADGIPGTLDDDLHLSPGSPCINRGDPNVSPPLPATDLDGNPRLQGCRVDMGAYESSDTQAQGDFDGTGTFDLADVAALQSCVDAIDSNPAWSQACLCVFDLDGNGNVDLTDFAGWLALFDGP